ncbi:MAG: STAS/SEC14 domain-containing protein [Cycloclasticus sp.]|jgi:Protein of unknown function (DUF3478).
MASHTLIQKGDLLEIHLSGTFKSEGVAELQKKVGESIRKGFNKVLVILDGFDGWGGSADSWGDISFAEQFDSHIQQLAIVGEAQWKDSFELFTMKGLRSFPIEYFISEEEQAARAWLK